MNSVHDMGGMHGMGPIERERNEPVFHARWEALSFAMNLAMTAWRKWNIDASRYHIELIPPAEYLRMSYYEKWHARLVELLIARGMVARTEIESGHAAEGTPKAVPPVTAADAARLLVRPNFKRPEAVAPARFLLGDTVRTRNINPEGHTRLPRYTRGKVGAIARDHGVYVFPDTNAHFLGEKPQHLYSVRFAARELWGEQASPLDSVFVDLWDDYLEPSLS